MNQLRLRMPDKKVLKFVEVHVPGTNQTIWTGPNNLTASKVLPNDPADPKYTVQTRMGDIPAFDDDMDAGGFLS